MKQLFKTVLLITFAFIWHTSFGQSHFFSGKVGFLSSTILPKDDTLTVKHRNATTFGLNFQFELTDHISVMTEANFIPEGMRVKNNEFDYKIKNNYLQLALKPVWYIHNDGLWDSSKVPGIFINAGPYVSYLLSSVTDGYVNGQKFEKVNTTEDYNEYDYGIIFGGGFSGLRSMYLQFNYYYGLAEIQQNSGKKNNSWEIGLMIRIPGLKLHN